MKKDLVTTEIIVKENKVGILRIGNVNYISLTDLARYQNSSDPSFTVKNWLRRINTIDYIGLWEEIHNQDFNLVEFDQIKTEYGRNSFAMSPTQWIKRTNAIGIISKGGRYSIGTFAHPDIAFEFASWLSPVQVNIVPVNIKYHDEYCKKIKELLEDEDIRVSYDDSKESMGKKVRNSNVMKNPITLIIGDNERDNNLISYRRLNSEETISMSIEEFINQIKNEIKQR